MTLHFNANFPAQPAPETTLKIAIIGSGISGSSAAWALSGRHDVTLFEASANPGGHTATVHVDYDGTDIAVDTGFIVYNELNYPQLTALFEHLGVATHESSMSFALSLDQGALEWSGKDFGALFAQKRNLLRLSFWLMLREIVRFNRLCVADRKAGSLNDLSIGDYLQWRGFSPGFRNNYLIPVAAAIWSTPSARMMEFPADGFVQFFENHRLVHYERPKWRTVSGGSENYLHKLLEPLGPSLRTQCPIASVSRSDKGILITSDTGRIEHFDKVIIAAHSDQALAMLADASAQEREILSSIPYHSNRVVLHRDPALMPRRKRIWSAWNYLSTSGPSDPGRPDRERDISVTYWMNALQGIDESKPLFVTLNPQSEPDPAMVFAEFAYEHPQFDASSLSAQRRLSSVQGINHTYFAGAWTGFGFHEDGLRSGLAAARALGASVPWEVSAKPGHALPCPEPVAAE